MPPKDKDKSISLSHLFSHGVSHISVPTPIRNIEKFPSYLPKEKPKSSSNKIEEENSLVTHS